MSDQPRDPGSLPRHRPEHVPPPPAGLPRQRRGTAPQGRSRYPDYDVLEQAGHWDEATRRVVLARVEDVPAVRFFSADQARTLRCFCDVVTAQDEEPRIPVLEMVDAKLHAGRLDGYQHADLPDDREVWRLAARGLDECARAGVGASPRACSTRAPARAARPTSRPPPTSCAWRS